MWKTIHNAEQQIIPWRQILALALIGLVCVLFWLDQEQNQLASHMVRLHVLANSDTEEDQALKLRVRDAVLQVAEPWLQEVHEIDGAAQALEAHLSVLQQTAQSVVDGEGYPYPVTVSLQESWFPTKQYDGFALPAGKYQALRIIIGEGQGQNWWCVVFPPLCVSSATQSVTETAREAGLTEQEVFLMAEEEESYVIKFKAIEWWENLKHSWE